MKRMHVFALVAMSFLLTAAATQAQNLLLNPGFETDAFPNQDPLPFATDWNLANPGEFNTVSAPGSPVHSGNGSLRITSVQTYGVPLALQTFPANPGEEYNLQGYMRIDNALTGDTRAVLKIVFGPGDLEPASISIGTADAEPFFGVLGTPQLNNTSTTGTWTFAEAQGVAPEGTTEVSFFAILVDAEPSEAYFDDLVATLVIDDGTPGDFDDDGDVDGRDFLVWQRGDSPTALSASDLTTWQTNYGNPLVATQAVPEPASVCLALLGVAAIFRRRMI
jgi:hypothetical protein